jgi:HTH-type transcriptional regulator/antitoxin HipB
MRQVRTVADLGAVVRAARRENNWTQAELGRRAGVSRQWIVALESGQASRAELVRVLAVLAVLDLTLSLPSPARTDKDDKEAARSPATGTPVRRPEAAQQSPQARAEQNQPWLDLDSHLASFTRTTLGTQDRGSRSPTPGANRARP